MDMVEVKRRGKIGVEVHKVSRRLNLSDLFGVLSEDLSISKKVVALVLNTYIDVCVESGKGGFSFYISDEMKYNIKRKEVNEVVETDMVLPRTVFSKKTSLKTGVPVFTVQRIVDESIEMALHYGMYGCDVRYKGLFVVRGSSMGVATGVKIERSTTFVKDIAASGYRCKLVVSSKLKERLAANLLAV